jgi:hypothetical protein
MTTTSEAYTVLRGILENSVGLPPLRWQNQDEDSTGKVCLPDIPAPFLYTEFLTESGSIVSFGGGRHQNRYRVPGRLDIFVFVPRGWGLLPATDYAEQAAALFRSYRDAQVSCFGATVYPGGDGANLKPIGLPSEVSNYFWASAEIELFFDQIG